MVKQRDGPGIAETTPGPRGKRQTRAVSSAPSEISTQVRAPPSPSQNRRSQRRQEAAWRGFAVRLYVPPGRSAHALYVLLKLAARRFGLEVGTVDEIHDSTAPTKGDPK
jgi:hypothetical protein